MSAICAVFRGDGAPVPAAEITTLLDALADFGLEAEKWAPESPAAPVALGCRPVRVTPEGHMVPPATPIQRRASGSRRRRPHRQPFGTGLKAGHFTRRGERALAARVPDRMIGGLDLAPGRQRLPRGPPPAPRNYPAIGLAPRWVVVQALPSCPALRPPKNRPAVRLGDQRRKTPGIGP